MPTPEEIILKWVGDSTSAEEAMRRIEAGLTEVSKGIPGSDKLISQFGKSLDGLSSKGMQQVAVGLKQVGTEAGGAASGGVQQLQGAITSVVSALGIMQVVNAFKGLVGEAMNAYKSYEMLGMSIQSLIAKEMVQAGEAKNVKDGFELAAPAAKELLDWTQKLAIESPLDQESVAAAFKLSMAYGFTSAEAKELTQTMIDFTAGTGRTGDTMQRIALALGQIKARGKLAGGEMMQLTEAGLNVREALVRAGTVAGLTAANFQQMQEKGLIPADKAIQGIVKSLQTDFKDAAKNSAGTFSGLLTSLEDIKSVGLREFFAGTFKAIQPLLKAIVDAFSSPQVIQAISSIGNIIGGLVKQFAPLIAIGAVMGTVTSSIIGVAVAAGVLAPALATVTAILPTIMPIILGINAAILALAVVMGMLYLAWQNNWGGIRDVVARAWATIAPLLTQIQTLISFWGNRFSYQAQQIWNAFVTLIKPVFVWLSETIGKIDWVKMAAGLSDTINVIGGLISGLLDTIRNLIAGKGRDSFTPLNDALLDVITLLALTWQNIIAQALDWGFNLVISIANGIISGAGYLANVVVDVINSAIAPFLAAFSPPKAGPLSKIAEWGKGVMDTFVHAFGLADFGVLSDVLSPIEIALKSAVSAGTLDTQGFYNLFGNVRTQVAELIAIFRTTGQVSEETLGKIGATLGAGSEELTKFLRLTMQYEKAQSNVASIEDEVAAAEKKGFVPAALKAKLEAAKKQASEAKNAVDWQKQYLALQQKGVDMQLELINALKQVAKELAKTKQPKVEGITPPGGPPPPPPFDAEAAKRAEENRRKLLEHERRGATRDSTSGLKNLSTEFDDVKRKVQEFLAMPIGDRIREMFRGLGSATGVDFLGGFAALKTWMDANLPAIQANIGTAFNFIKSIVMSFVDVMTSTVVPNFTSAFQTIGSLFGPIQVDWGLLWEGLKLVVMGVAIAIGAIVAGIAGVVVGAFSGISSMAKSVAEGVQSVWNNMKGAFEGFVTYFTGLYLVWQGLLTGNLPLALQGVRLQVQGIVTWISNTVQLIYNLITTVFGSIASYISGFIKGIVAFFTDLYDQLVGGSIIPDLVNGAIMWFTKMADTINSIVVMVRDTLVGAFTTLKDFLEKVFGPWMDAYRQNVLAPIVATFAGIGEWIQKLIDWAEELGRKLAGIKIPTLLQQHSPSPFEQSFMAAAAAAREATEAVQGFSGVNLGGLAGMVGAGLTGMGGTSVTVEGGMNFPNVRDGRDAVGVRRELSRTAQRAYMSGRA